MAEALVLADCRGMGGEVPDQGLGLGADLGKRALGGFRFRARVVAEGVFERENLDAASPGSGSFPRP